MSSKNWLFNKDETTFSEAQKSLSTQLPPTAPLAGPIVRLFDSDTQTLSQVCLPSTQLVDTVNSNYSVESELGTSTSQLTQPPQWLTSTPPSLPSPSQPGPSRPLSLSTSQCTSRPSVQQECKL